MKHDSRYRENLWKRTARSKLINKAFWRVAKLHSFVFASPLRYQSSRPSFRKLRVRHQINNTHYLDNKPAAINEPKVAPEAPPSICIPLCTRMQRKKSISFFLGRSRDRCRGLGSPRLNGLEKGNLMRALRFCVWISVRVDTLECFGFVFCLE